MVAEVFGALALEHSMKNGDSCLRGGTDTALQTRS